jgi:hypothetical protein
MHVTWYRVPVISGRGLCALLCEGHEAPSNSFPDILKIFEELYFLVHMFTRLELKSFVS